MKRNLDVHDDVFLTKEGHLFYVNSEIPAVFFDIPKGSEIDADCSIIYGHKEVYKRPCHMKLKSSQDREPLLLILIRGRDIGRTAEPKFISIDRIVEAPAVSKDEARPLPGPRSFPKPAASTSFRRPR